MKKVYLVMKNADLTEGRGPMFVEAICEKEYDANMIALENEPYGNPRQFTDIKIMPVLTNSSDYIIQKNNEAKKQALAKLTAKERELLGL